jgi:chromosome partitioning protein
VEAAKIADLALIVVRPSPMDLHAMAATVAALKPLRQPCAFVLNQAPSHKLGREPSLVNEAIELLLRYGLPVAPVALRARTLYQHAYAEGQSVLESDPQSSAASEIAELWTYVSERLCRAKQPATPIPRSSRLPVALMARAPASLHPTPAG